MRSSSPPPSLGQNSGLPWLRLYWLFDCTLYIDPLYKERRGGEGPLPWPGHWPPVMITCVKSGPKWPEAQAVLPTFMSGRSSAVACLPQSFQWRSGAGWPQGSVAASSCSCSQAKQTLAEGETADRQAGVRFQGWGAAMVEESADVSCALLLVSASWQEEAEQCTQLFTPAPAPATKTVHFVLTAAATIPQQTNKGECQPMLGKYWWIFVKISAEQELCTVLSSSGANQLGTRRVSATAPSKWPCPSAAGKIFLEYYVCTLTHSKIAIFSCCNS